jgi:hypothetical protein
MNAASTLRRLEGIRDDRNYSGPRDDTSETPVGQQRKSLWMLWITAV